MQLLEGSSVIIDEVITTRTLPHVVCLRGLLIHIVSFVWWARTRGAVANVGSELNAGVDIEGARLFQYLQLRHCTLNLRCELAMTGDRALTEHKL